MKLFSIRVFCERNHCAYGKDDFGKFNVEDQDPLGGFLGKLSPIAGEIDLTRFENFEGRSDNNFIGNN